MQHDCVSVSICLCLEIAEIKWVYQLLWITIKLSRLSFMEISAETKLEQTWPAFIAVCKARNSSCLSKDLTLAQDALSVLSFGTLTELACEVEACQDFCCKHWRFRLLSFVQEDAAIFQDQNKPPLNQLNSEYSPGSSCSVSTEQRALRTSNSHALEVNQKFSFYSLLILDHTDSSPYFLH